MTSKNLFFKLIRQDFKKRVWCPILIFITYFLSLEVRLLMKMDKYIKDPGARYYYDDGFHDAVTFVRDYFFGRDAAMMSVVTCAVALLCGISGYVYLHSRTQLDTYHSLPVSRIQMFWSKYVSGILQFFLPFVIHTLICAGIAAGRDAFFVGTVPALLSYIGLHLVIFVMTYAVAVFAVVLTGNLIVSILGTVILFAYSAVVDVLTYLLSTRFFETYVTYGNRIDAGLSEKIWCFSPLSMLLRLFARPDNLTMEAAQKFYKYDTSYVWVLVAAAVVYSLAAYILYRKRASEAAGNSIVFRAAEPVVKTMLVIPVSFFAAVFFSEISPDTASDSWFLFGLIFGFVVFCILVEVIFRLDIRGALMHKKQFLLNAACTALIFVVLRYDVLGYDTYVPADSQLQSCAVSIQQLMPLTQKVQVSEFGFHYLGSDDYRMANMEMQGNPSVMELARKAAEEQLVYRYFDYYEGIEEEPEYIETMNRQESYQPVSFGFKLLDGKTVYRKYFIDIADADTVRLLSDIFDDFDYKLGSTPLFNENWNIAFDSVRCESNFKTAKIELTPEMQTKLIETYKKEYAKLSLDTVMSVIPVGTIDFMTRSERSYISYSDAMVVYPQFAETIALLQEYGFDMEEKLTADDVDSIKVYDYTNDATESEAYMTEYTDKEQVQQLLDNLVSDGLSHQIDHFAVYLDKQYDVEIRYHVEHGTYFCYCFIEEKVPDFVKLYKK